ncbi:MAG: family 10 glycosylhydrolase [Bacteroidales bacterium]|nr:family 10 glycosylhydrolase [Bacteroidales bacterium]
MQLSKVLAILMLGLSTVSVKAQEIRLPKHEMRGAWVATLVNIDWPSKKGTSVRSQKNEYVELLDSLESLNMNTVLFQVRPHGDAFYKSEFEPWSEYLTGTQGKAPGDSLDSYDPLQFLIEETHKRGMEFHAWANPYRITAYSDLSRLDSSHVYFKHPEWFVKHTDGRYYMIPGVKESQKFVLDVVKELVGNYDIDALHFDDYFYQYPDSKTGKNIDDSVQYVQYQAEFDSITGVRTDTLKIETGDTVEYKITEVKREFDNLHDWRRNNVNQMVEAVYNTIKETKPWVKFGISPFGIYRNKTEDYPNGSDTKATTNYFELYADVLLWLDKGWLDYITPQIYWRNDHTKASFTVLNEWWGKQDLGKAKLFIGQGIYRVGSPDFQKYDFWKTTDGLLNQVELIRANKAAEGSMFFSAKYFMTNPLNINQDLGRELYSRPAIAPVYADAKINTQVVDTILASGNKNEGIKLQWKDLTEGNIRYYLVYRFEGEEIGDMTVANNIVAKVAGYGVNQVYVDAPVSRWKKYTYVVTSVDRFNVESEASAPITVKAKRNKVVTYKK